MTIKSIMFTCFLFSLGLAGWMGIHLVETSMTLWRLRDAEGVVGVYWTLANGFNNLSAAVVLFLLLAAWLFFRGYRDPSKVV